MNKSAVLLALLITLGCAGASKKPIEPPQFFAIGGFPTTVDIYGTVQNVQGNKVTVLITGISCRAEEEDSPCVVPQAKNVHRFVTYTLERRDKQDCRKKQTCVIGKRLWTDIATKSKAPFEDTLEIVENETFFPTFYPAEWRRYAVSR